MKKINSFFKKSRKQKLLVFIFIPMLIIAGIGIAQAHSCHKKAPFSLGGQSQFLVGTTGTSDASSTFNYIKPNNDLTYNPSVPEQETQAYITGYSSDEGSTSKIAFSDQGIHNKAGGDGTLNDPITAAVPVENLDTLKPGTILYIPDFQKYFVIEDQCGENAGQCVESGYQYHVDLWTQTNSCSEKITGAHQIIINPSNSKEVKEGPLSCS